MNGNSAVLDSNVIIDDSKGKISISEIIDNYDNLFISIITYIEILGYKFTNSKEQKKIEKILNILPIIELNRNVAYIAIKIRRKNKIKLPDALILASAKSINADLITSNAKDFINIDKNVKIVVPNQLIF